MCKVVQEWIQAYKNGVKMFRIRSWQISEYEEKMQHDEVVISK